MSIEARGKRPSPSMRPEESRIPWALHWIVKRKEAMSWLEVVLLLLVVVVVVLLLLLLRKLARASATARMP